MRKEKHDYNIGKMDFKEGAPGKDGSFTGYVNGEYCTMKFYKDKWYINVSRFVTVFEQNDNQDQQG